jgi:chromosome segregation ATPase
MEKLQQELKAAQERYFLQMGQEATLREEIKGLEQRVQDASQQITLIDARIKALTEQRTTVHTEIVAGSKPMNAADKLSDSLATARRQAADYDEILLLSRNTLEAKRSELLHHATADSRNRVYHTAAKLLLEEIKPQLQRIAAVYSLSVPGHTPQRTEKISSFITDACFAHDEIIRPMLAEVEQQYLTVEEAE